MNLFENVKAVVTVRQAAEHYGLKVGRGNMACCPFHNDHTPSMKLNEDYFYCFGCGATGDVIDLIFLWAFEGLQRLVANNFKFTESQRTRDNREAVKRDSNNVFDFLESEGYIRLKADCTISSKDLYEIYRMWCEENNLTPLKRRSFSDSVIASQTKYNLEDCNKIINAAGRRVWGFFGIEAIAKPNINGFSDVSERTYVPEDWR